MLEKDVIWENRETVNISTQVLIHQITFLAASTRLAMSWHSVKVTECFPSLEAALFLVKQALKNSSFRVLCCLGEVDRPQKYLQQDSQ